MEPGWHNKQDARLRPNWWWFKIFIRENRGSSLVAVLVSLGIAGILAVVVARTMGDGIRAQKSVNIRSDLQQLRQNILSRLDCTKTLGNTVPVACSDTAVTLKDRLGKSLASNQKIGDWTIDAKCPSTCDVDGNEPGKSGNTSPCNQLVVTATWPGIDPLTGKDRDLTPTNAHGATVSTDLFGWTGAICAPNYTAAGCPANTTMRDSKCDTAWSESIVATIPGSQMVCCVRNSYSNTIPLAQLTALTPNCTWPHAHYPAASTPADNASCQWAVVSWCRNRKYLGGFISQGGGGAASVEVTCLGYRF